MRLIFFFLFITNICFAAELAPEAASFVQQQEIVYDETPREPLSFDRDYLEEAKNDSDFQYEEVEDAESLWSQFKTWLNRMWSSFWRWLLGDLEASSFVAFLLELLPYLILAGILALVVWLFIKLDIGGSLMKQPAKPEVFLTEEERIIQSQDINALIQKALNEQNYRLAVRYQYLLTLKKLVDREAVIFQAEKTNADYIKEIEHPDWQSQFKLLTRIYDFIWYGNFEISQQQYQRAETNFKKLQDELQKASDE